MSLDVGLRPIDALHLTALESDHMAMCSMSLHCVPDNIIQDQLNSVKHEINGKSFAQLIGWDVLVCPSEFCCPLWSLCGVAFALVHIVLFALITHCVGVDFQQAAGSQLQ